jgi:hypothetical protein
LLHDPHYRALAMRFLLPSSSRDRARLAASQRRRPGEIASESRADASLIRASLVVSGKLARWLRTSTRTTAVAQLSTF